jgi:superfamily II DNA or RNA helicase
MSPQCKLFFERTEKLKDGQSFSNPFSGKVMKKGGPGYLRLLKRCQNEGLQKEVVYKKYSCDGYPKKPGFQPKEHQLKFKDLFEEVLDGKRGSQRGALAYFGLGSGKTCTYAICIDEYLERGGEKVFIFTNASLRTNLLTEYCSFCGKNRKQVPEFIFLSLNDTSILNKLPETFDNCLIVIDEIHHLTHGKYNNGPLLTGVYDKMVKGKQNYLIGGSGTPIETHVEELYYLSKLFNPELFYSIDYFMQDLERKEGVYKPKNINEFTEKICSFVCHYEPKHDLSSYPTVYQKRLNVKMDPSRINAYIDEVEKEFQLLKIKPKEEDRFKDPEQYKKDQLLFFIASTHMKSSQLSNFDYPMVRVNRGVGTPPNTGIPDDVKPDGWVTDDTLDVLPDRGEKINVILQDILDHDGKHVVYTRFKTYYGARLIGALCEVIGIPYRFFDGDMDDQERLQVIRSFNADDNKFGNKIKVLIMTEAAQEGLNLLAVRRLHILEQPVNKTSLDQVVGRAVRYQSHVMLPEDQRDVTILNYFISLEDPLETKFYSSDYLCFESAQTKEKSISEIKLLMKSCDI